MQTVARLTFSGPITEYASLRDGDFVLMILGNQVRSGGVFLDGDNNGTPGGNRTDSFSRLFGDVNGDGIVNYSDLLVYKQTRALGLYNNAFDFNNDGVINDADETELMRRVH